MVQFVQSDSEQLLEVLANSMGLIKARGGVLVLKDTRYFRAGELIAVNSSTNKALPRKSTQLAATAATGVQVLTVDDVHAFEVGDVLTVGDASGTYIIQSIDRVTNIITLTAVTSGGTDPLPIDARVYVNANAVFTAVGIALTPMRAAKDTGKAVEDGDAVYGDVAIRGAFVEAKIQTLDSNAKTDLGGSSEINGVYAIL